MGTLTPEQITSANARKGHMFLWLVVEKYADENLKKQLRKCKSSKTYKTLFEDGNEFFLKSSEELMWLLEKEYAKDWDAWNWQAGIEPCSIPEGILNDRINRDKKRK